jgi:hypothetical protein
VIITTTTHDAITINWSRFNATRDGDSWRLNIELQFKLLIEQEEKAKGIERFEF